jgi:hypothetical protein
VIYVMSFPMPPSLGNASGQSRHWRTIAGKKRQYLRELDLWSVVTCFDAPPKVPHERLQILRSEMHLGNRMDQDNAMIRHKWVLDWLATRGYIGNDRNFEWVRFPEQIVKRGQEYTITLTLATTE